MATVLGDRIEVGCEAACPAEVEARAGGPTRPRSSWPRSTVTVLVFLGLMVAFAAHLAEFGAWVVDDAGISMAYAVNLAHGHGLVARPGAAPVEAFSDPLWVGVLAVSSRAGILSSAEVMGLPGYIAVVKGLALVLHGAVLGALAIVIRRVLTIVRGRPPALSLFLALWGGAGLLLAANTSYVVWMGSGLENPMFAAEVAALAAVATTALPRPDRRAMVVLGALAGAAALTRPDGAIYLGVVFGVAALADARGFRPRARLAGWGCIAFVALFGSYLAFRLWYFGALVPNTAVAKDQGLPGLADLTRVETVVRAYGWPLTAIALAGGGAAFVVLWRSRRWAVLRVVGGVWAVLLIGVGAFVVLPTDWMGELRFLTPVWPLLSVAAVLGVAQLAALASTRVVRAAVALTLVVFGAVVFMNWRERSRSFASEPTLPLCTVSFRFGLQFDAVARVLGRDPHATVVALPDIGGVLLASDLRVIDLAGLADVDLARLIAAGDETAVADHVLSRRPTIVNVHGGWVTRSGLLDAPRFAAEYVDIRGGEDWVRRDALNGTANPTATLRTLRGLDPGASAPGPLDSCAAQLFG